MTLGLEKEFGHDRVLDTPISEAAIAGVAAGAAMGGLMPVADVQYGDFLFLAMDQLANQAAKMRYMSGGKLTVPMVFRAPVGATTRGAQHGQSLEAFLMHVPGLKVACPSNPYDGKGLLKSAIRDPNPVIFFEHKLLYGSKGARKEAGGMETRDARARGGISGSVRPGQGRTGRRAGHHRRQPADGAPVAAGGQGCWRRMASTPK